MENGLIYLINPESLGGKASIESVSTLKGKKNSLVSEEVFQESGIIDPQRFRKKTG